MASISILNPKAEFAKSQHAFNINLAAARGLFDVLKTNLGPKGTMKMFVTFPRSPIAFVFQACVWCW